MKCQVFTPGKGLAVPSLSRGDGHFLLCPPPEELGFCGIVLGQAAALVENKSVESADGKNFGVPVMKGNAVGLWELGSRETFHARSARDINIYLGHQRFRLRSETYASATHFKKFGPSLKNSSQPDHRP